MSTKQKENLWEMFNTVIKWSYPPISGLVVFLVAGHISQEIRLSELESNRWTEREQAQFEKEHTREFNTQIRKVRDDLHLIRESQARLETKLENVNK